MAEAVGRQLGYWHSDHYDNMTQHTDRLAGPIWDKLTDHPEGLTVDQLVWLLEGDLRVRPAMSFYLSFGEEQAERGGAKFEENYRVFPWVGTWGDGPVEERYRYVLRERIRYRLELMRSHGFAVRKVIQSGQPTIRAWTAGRSPVIWEPLPGECPACGRRNTRNGRRRLWVYGEGLGPSIDNRRRNLIDAIRQALDKKHINSSRELLAETLDLLADWEKEAA